jgi:hypothetical protein
MRLVLSMVTRTHLKDGGRMDRFKTPTSRYNAFYHRSRWTDRLRPVQRRTTKYAPPAATAKVQPAAPKLAAKHTPVTQPKKENSLPSRKESASETNTPGQSASQSAPTVGTLKRSDSKPGAKKDKTAGDIFKSFAKAKAKPKEDKSKESTPAPVEDGMLFCCLLLTRPASDFYRTYARHVRG